jgi:TonB family protein
MPGNRDYFGGITDARDRRRYSRQITSLNYIKLGETNGGILLDVSEDGLAFTAAESLVGEFIPRLRFQLAENADWIEASGRIIWLNDSKKGAGIQFVSISNEDREQIRRWILSKTPSEIQDSARAARKIHKESEITTFPAPRNDTRKIETQYEILEPDLQRMFPSESVLGPEAAQPNPVRAPQVETPSAIHASPHEEYFPSESAMRREPAATEASEVEIQPHTREAQREEFPSNVPQVRTTVPRFASTLQVETPPETHQTQRKESVASERARPIEQPEAATEPEPASVPNTNEFRPSDFARRAARLPTFGYQTSAGYQKHEDWTNWVDPATAHRSKLGFVVLGVILVVAAFAIGMSFGHGSFDEFVESMRRLMPDKYQQAPTVATPSAESAATPLSTAVETKTDANADAPTQAQGAEPAAQTSETPTASNPDTPASKNEKTQAAETPSKTETSSGSEKGKSAISQEDSTSVLVTAAGTGGQPFRLTTPETAVSASSSVAISSQASVLVPREAGAEASQQPKRLQPGTLLFHVDPQYPRKLARNEVAIVKVLATVGENGQVINVQQISGPQQFASAAISAVREWRYSPTLFDGRPVKTEQTITIAFRSR